MPDWIQQTPVILKVLGSLLVILVINAASKRLLAAAAVGTVCLAAWLGFPAGDAVTIAWDRLASTRNTCLLAIIFQVVWLSSQMAETGIMRDLVASVQSRMSPRAACAVLPAMIGLLPMPGGAAFSAPLVEQCDRDGQIDPLVKTQVNYWFRHIWEYWWPLYPGVLLALDITGFDVWQFALLQAPLSLVAAGAGYWFLLRRIPVGKNDHADGHERSTLGRLVGLLSPILVVVCCYACTQLLAPRIGATNRYVPMMIGLLCAVLFLQWRRPLDGAAWRRILLSPRPVKLAALIAVIRIYGAFVEARLPGGTAVVEQMRAELHTLGIPTWAMVVLIPFFSGITTGIAVGFVGASFPVVLSLVGDGAPLDVRMAATVMAYASGFMGMMLSPVHVCLIVTSEHFRTRVHHGLVRLIPAAATVLAGAVVLQAVVRAVVRP